MTFPVVDVTWIDMDAVDTQDPFRQVLGPDETERALRFHHPRDSRRFVVRRGALRIFLARHLDQPAERIRYLRNESGKPSVAGGGIHFSLSHSHSLALIAIARDGEVGCDI